MQVKKSSASGTLIYRANRQLVQANRKASREESQVSNKDLVQAAAQVQVKRREPVKTQKSLSGEREPESPLPVDEQASVIFSVCYLEQQQKNGGESVSCFRSTGAVPIPTRRCSTVLNGTLPKFPKPRKTSLPELLLRTADFQMLEPLEEVDHFEELEAGVRSKISVIDDWTVRAEASDPPHVSMGPPKKVKKNDCKKHTKCHCALFSQQVAGFFDVRK